MHFTNYIYIFSNPQELDQEISAREVHPILNGEYTNDVDENSNDPKKILGVITRSKQRLATATARAANAMGHYIASAAQIGNLDTPTVSYYSIYMIIK